MSSSDGPIAKYGLGDWAFFFIDEEERAEITAWMRRGKCHGITELADVFVPEVDDEEDDWKRNSAMAICNGKDGGPVCPVRATCAEYAIDNRLTRGVFGGLSSRARKQRSRQRRKAG